MSISNATFDILEKLSDPIPAMKGGFARGTGGVDVDVVVPAMATEIDRVRHALDIAVSRGCDHCAASIRGARSIADSDRGPHLFWVQEAHNLRVATIRHDDFSLIEVAKRDGNAFLILTIHSGNDETGRWEDLSIKLNSHEAAQLARVLQSATQS